MSDYYPGRPGMNEWEYDGVTSESKGKYRLHTGYGADFGEPLVLDGTGTKSTPSKKRSVLSYTGTAGATKVIGASLNIKVAINTLTEEDYGLRGSHVRKRDIAILFIGVLKSRNVGDTDVEIGNTIIGADGGFEKMTVDSQLSYGKALQRIPAGEPGYIWVNPDYEKADI